MPSLHKSKKDMKETKRFSFPCPSEIPVGDTLHLHLHARPPGQLHTSGEWPCNEVAMLESTGIDRINAIGGFRLFD